MRSYRIRDLNVYLKKKTNLANNPFLEKGFFLYGMESGIAVSCYYVGGIEIKFHELRCDVSFLETDRVLGSAVFSRLLAEMGCYDPNCRVLIQDKVVEYKDGEDVELCFEFIYPKCQELTKLSVIFSNTEFGHASFYFHAQNILFLETQYTVDFYNYEIEFKKRS